MLRAEISQNDLPGVPINALVLRDLLRRGEGRQICAFALEDIQCEVRLADDSLWVLLRRPGKGGLALRTAHCPGGRLTARRVHEAGALAAFTVDSPLGAHKVVLSAPEPGRTLLRCVVTLTPERDLLIPFLPRDLYPFSESGDTTAASGQVEAAQRGLNAGLVFLRMSRPAFGSALYFQNLTALNDYFEAVDAKPDGCVGGQWPELGYQPPSSPDSAAPPTRPLKAGRPVVMSDAFLNLSPTQPDDQRASAALFLDLLAGVYPHIDHPDTTFRNWPAKAAATLRDLSKSEKVTERHYGHRYIRPYVGAEHPDSMVQLAVLKPLRDYADWLEKPVPLADALNAGVPKFFDEKLGIVRRYLPDVGDDKDADEVDSWYLYHPLANLGRLAHDGDQQARTLFLASMDYAIKVARHFKYVWPIQYNVKTLAVIKQNRKEGDPGQSDVGGLYAHVMLQAFDMTGEPRFREEAEAAVRALKPMQFDLEYQANITAWAVVACLRLHQLTGDAYFRDQSLVFLAGFFHNSILWESRIGGARHYSVFLGETCLHDGPYMALYECFESYWAFIDYLALGGDDLPRSIRMLMAEYCRYTLHRAWFYYPAELPPEVLAEEIRNGHIDRKLAIPLEDLYAGGDPAGQVGQETYGCGAAFVFTSRAFHSLRDTPFQLFCDYPIYDLAVDGREVRFGVRGVSGFACRLRLLPTNGKPLPKIELALRHGERLKGRRTRDGHWEAEIPADERLVVRWTPAPTRR